MANYWNLLVHTSKEILTLIPWKTALFLKIFIFSGQIFVNPQSLNYSAIAFKTKGTASHIADRVHVMSQINKELDDRRKLEKRRAEKLKNKQEKEQKIQGITNSKYPLLMVKIGLGKKKTPIITLRLTEVRAGKVCKHHADVTAKRY